MKILIETILFALLYATIGEAAREIQGFTYLGSYSGPDSDSGIGVAVIGSYYASNTEATWADATSSCESIDSSGTSRLTAVVDANEDFVIKGFMTRAKLTSTWTSGQYHQCSWKWHTGQLLTSAYSNPGPTWVNGVAPTPTQGYAIYISNPNTFDYGWSSAPVDTMLPYICETHA